jgi:hypothetical protein
MHSKVRPSPGLAEYRPRLLWENILERRRGNEKNVFKEGGRIKEKLNVIGYRYPPTFSEGAQFLNLHFDSDLIVDKVKEKAIRHSL